MIISFFLFFSFRLTARTVTATQVCKRQWLNRISTHFKTRSTGGGGGYDDDGGGGNDVYGGCSSIGGGGGGVDARGNG